MSTGFFSAAKRAVSLSNISGTVVNCTTADMIGVPLVAREKAGRGKMRPENKRRERRAKRNSPEKHAEKIRPKNTPERREKQYHPAISVSDVCTAAVFRPGEKKFRPLSRCRIKQTVPPENINLTSLRQRIIFSAVALAFRPITYQVITPGGEGFSFCFF
jgi:hypothetical protein